MPRSPATLFAAGVLGLCTLLASSGCSPTFNWRDVRPGDTPLSLLLPCKPDKAQKSVPLGGQPTELRMLGCEGGDLTFAISVADVGDAAKVALILEQWQSATLANMKAAPVAGARGTPGDQNAQNGQRSQRLALKLKGASAEPSPILVVATGLSPDGSAVRGQAAYFAKGSQVYQAVIYGKAIAPEVADTFFGSLRFDN